MGDDAYSASQLRNRYGPGGTEGDSNLSASQLRSRHGVQNRDFAKNNDAMQMKIIGGVVLFVLILGWYMGWMGGQK